MVEHAALLEDLKKHVRVLEADLRERSEDPGRASAARVAERHGLGPRGA